MSASVLPQFVLNVPGKLVSSLFYSQVMFDNVPCGTFESRTQISRIKNLSLVPAASLFCDSKCTSLEMRLIFRV